MAHECICQYQVDTPLMAELQYYGLQVHKVLLQVANATQFIPVLIRCTLFIQGPHSI